MVNQNDYEFYDDRQTKLLRKNWGQQWADRYKKLRAKGAHPLDAHAQVVDEYYAAKKPKS